MQLMTENGHQTKNYTEIRIGNRFSKIKRLIEDPTQHIPLNKTSKKL